jgi:glycosyltransferase involved in cell wall biosynthesis
VQGYEADLRAIGLKLKLGLKPVNGLLPRIFAFHDSKILQASDRVLCVSLGLVEYVQSLLQKKDWSKITFIPHSLQYTRKISKDAMLWAEELVRSLEGSKEAGLCIVMVIGAGPTKGTELALMSLKCMLKRNPHVLMIIVSKTIDPRYERKAKELKLSDNILFLKNLARDYVIALLSKCSIYLSTSFSEGFSFAMCEAMALGVPIVTFANKSLRHVMKENAVATVLTINPQDYAKECMSILKDKTRRQNLVERATSYISPFVNFSEQERLKLIHSLISTILNNGC